MTVQDQLNRAMPAMKHGMVGDVLADLIAGYTALQAREMSRALSPITFAIKAGGSTLAKASSAFIAVASGVLVQKAANTDMAALAGTLATAKSAAWAWYIDSAGNLTTSAKTADAASSAAAVALLPAPPAGLAQLGVVVIDNATGSNFVGGTTALDTASLTVTYYPTPGAIVLAGTTEGTVLKDLEHRAA